MKFLTLPMLAVSAFAQSQFTVGPPPVPIPGPYSAICGAGATNGAFCWIVNDVAGVSMGLAVPNVAPIPGQVLSFVGAIPCPALLNPAPASCGQTAWITPTAGPLPTPPIGLTSISNYHPAGSSGSGTPQSGEWWTDGSTGAACSPIAPYPQCVLRFFGSNDARAVGFRDAIPAGWISGAVTLTLDWDSGGGVGLVTWTLRLACLGNGTVIPPTLSAIQLFPSVTVVGGKHFTASIAPNLKGCAAGNSVLYYIGRSDASGYMNINGAALVYQIP